MTVIFHHLPFLQVLVFDWFRLRRHIRLTEYTGFRFLCSSRVKGNYRRFAWWFDWPSFKRVDVVPDAVEQWILTFLHFVFAPASRGPSSDLARSARRGCFMMPSDGLRQAHWCTSFVMSTYSRILLLRVLFDLFETYPPVADCMPWSCLLDSWHWYLLMIGLFVKFSFVHIARGGRSCRWIQAFVAALWSNHHGCGALWSMFLSVGMAGWRCARVFENLRIVILDWRLSFVQG